MDEADLDRDTSWVAVHAEWGVYVGHAMGFAFFSLQDCAGQAEVTTFDTHRDAAEHVANDLGMAAELKSFCFVAIACEHDRGATADELVAAGIAEKMVAPLREASLAASPTLH